MPSMVSRCCRRPAARRAVVDHLALVVVDVAEIESVPLRMSKLWLTLRCAFDGAWSPAALDDVVPRQALHAQAKFAPGRRRRCASGCLPATGRSGWSLVTLATGTATQLVVDTARFVALGGDRRPPASDDPAGDQALRSAWIWCDSALSLGASRAFQLRLPEVAAEEDVGTADRPSAGGSGVTAPATGPGDDLGLPLVSGAEHLVLDAGLLRWSLETYRRCSDRGGTGPGPAGPGARLS